MQGYRPWQFLFNLPGVIVVGSAVGRRDGWWRWIVVCVFSGTATGLVAPLCLPHRVDSGSSAAVAGPIGALAVPMGAPDPSPP
ncbi:rhomboid family intramembrane serine protease [Paeniglutamicibacter antarcticus]